MIPLRVTCVLCPWDRHVESEEEAQRVLVRHHQNVHAEEKGPRLFKPTRPEFVPPPMALENFPPTPDDPPGVEVSGFPPEPYPLPLGLDRVVPPVPHVPWWHIHRPQVARRGGIYLFQRCRCGALRVIEPTNSVSTGVGKSPLPAGWPEPGQGWKHEADVRYPRGKRRTDPPPPPMGPGGGGAPEGTR